VRQTDLVLVRLVRLIIARERVFGEIALTWRRSHCYTNMGCLLRGVLWGVGTIGIGIFRRCFDWPMQDNLCVLVCCNAYTNVPLYPTEHRDI
jgi:hypothetical protein